MKAYAYQSRVVGTAASVIDFLGRIIFCGIRRDGPIEKSGVRRVLVIKLDHLGDCFLMTPLMENLQKIFQGVVVDVLCQETADPLFRGNPFIREIITFNYWRAHRGMHPEGFGRLMHIIRAHRGNYDMVIDARGEPIAALASYLLRARYRIGFQKEEIGSFFYTHAIDWSLHDHETDKYRHLLAALGLMVHEWQPKLYLSEEEKTATKKFLPSGDFVTFGMGSGAKYKQYPPERFAEVWNEKIRDDLSVVLLGSRGEEWEAEAFKKIASRNVIDLVGNLSIRETYSILGSAKLFLGNDSLLVHFAGALGIPTIDLANVAVNMNRWRALGPRSVIITGRKEGHKCLMGDEYPCPNMQAISTRDIQKAWETLCSGSTTTL
jgi:ADP-heptose:LPS heptosyltransferase